MDNMFCSGEEKDYFSSPEVYEILRNGITPQSMLDAARLIRDKDHRSFLMLPIGMYTEAETLGADADIKRNGILIKNYKYPSVSDLHDLPELNITDGAIKTVLDCTELAKNENVILKVSGAIFHSIFSDRANASV